jgi:hypothetical protein
MGADACTWNYGSEGDDRATHVPQRTASSGQLRSLPRLPPIERAAQALIKEASLNHATDLPSWSCGFDSRRPLSQADALFRMLPDDGDRPVGHPRARSYECSMSAR